MQATTTRPKITATTDGEGVVSHAGTRLFAPVASTATAWRMLEAVDDAALARVRDARAQARERAWLLRAEAGRDLPAARPVAGTGRLVLDVDARVECHSDKESAASHFKGGFGLHPICVWLDNTNEALAGLLRPGMPARTPPPSTSTCWTWRWRRSPTPTGTAPRSWSAPTAPAPPSSGWPTSGRCATPAAGRVVLGRVHHDRAGAGRDPGVAGACVDDGGRSRRPAVGRRHVAELTGLLPDPATPAGQSRCGSSSGGNGRTRVRN